MKQIEVTDEMYDFLMKLSIEINAQDNRSTAMPYFFQIQTKEQVPTMESCGTEAWHYDGSIIETEEEIKKVIFDYKEFDIESEHDNESYESYSDWEKDEILEKIGYQKIYYDYKDVYKNCFLTEKACKTHIESNKHHYNEPVDYLSYAFRNPELEKVYEFLCGLTGGKIHK
jgi:hypothetical protein